MGEYDNEINGFGSGIYRVGCSVRIQRLISVVNADGYGDIEELVSVPGMIGGLVCMNASIPSAKCCISDHLTSVEAFDGESIINLTRDDCHFGYRSSRFQKGKEIILSATFEFPEQDREVSARRVKARRVRIKEHQDNSLPNFGSVFSYKSTRIMRLVRHLGIGKGKSHFSKKTDNWLCCGGSFSDSLKAIQRVEHLHRLLGRRCEREVVVWE
jgi:UDP-N-acetylmuramate dehydrogenase